MTAVILQARLDSTRLPGKALLDLRGKPVIARVMESLSRVPAESRVLACDEASYASLLPIAREAGFSCVAGPKEDVLARYCVAARSVGASVIVRATGDNPFVFHEAASAALARFQEIRAAGRRCDFFAYTHMPHGAGVEIIDAASLLEAASLTDSPYDREHVGPSLYLHQDRFACSFEPAPRRWYLPRARVTIDTADDYERALAMDAFLSARGIDFPPDAESVIKAFTYVTEPIVLVAAEGPGTGHRARMESLALSLADGRRVFARALAPDGSLRPGETLPRKASLVVLDPFRSSADLVRSLSQIGPVLSIDDGGEGAALADYRLDIIPRPRGAEGSANRLAPELLPCPRNRRIEPASSLDEGSRVLVVAGGDNAARLALPVARSLASIFNRVTVIDPAASRNRQEGRLTVIGPVADLKETLHEYDLVVTHYGLTAFEAHGANVRVLTFSPTKYHRRLAQNAGFMSLPVGKHDPESLRAALSSLRAPSPIVGQGTDLAHAVRALAEGRRIPCPLCGAERPRPPTHRGADRTIVRCPECGMLYLSFHVDRRSVYGESYFFEEYKTQYGKTYLDDFDSIRIRGLERVSRIAAIRRGGGNSRPTVLDIGCAYGPFLAAARDSGWEAVGTDICEEAVAYVREELKIPAVRAAFPSLEDSSLPVKGPFDAVTLWFVIEHFEDLEPVLRRVGRLLVPGGVLAFSTPSAAGISARKDLGSFLGNSPLDHFTIWDPRSVRGQLERYGFKVVRVVSTGHHPERFPFARSCRNGTLAWRVLERVSRFLALGDTFEVYAVKRGTVHD